MRKALCDLCLLWRWLFRGFAGGFGGGVAEGAVGGAIAAVLGLLLGHVNALLGLAVEPRVRTMIKAVSGIDPDSDRRHAARWRT